MKQHWQVARWALQILPLVATVRWHLWRTPFARLQPYWSARVQNALDAHFSDKTATCADSEAPTRAQIDEVWNCAHAVRHAARLVPFASCLTQAMVLQLVLARRGYCGAICIGVNRSKARVSSAPTTQENATLTELGAKTANELESAAPSKMAQKPRNSGAAPAFRAHAWVEWRGKVLIGGDIRPWKPLTVFAPQMPKTVFSNSPEQNSSLAAPPHTAPLHGTKNPLS